ncbi:hypothetical protein BJ742DRAFT_359997 [Cladochytrium replicatum]|nr:hypothetical protein BJ742DRAFT_359997 [Cladochytrium replicatum]
MFAPAIAVSPQTNRIPEGGLPLIYSLFPPFGFVSITRSLSSSVFRPKIAGFVISQILFTFEVGTLYGVLGMYLQFIRRTTGGFGLDPLLGLYPTNLKDGAPAKDDSATCELTDGEDTSIEQNAVIGVKMFETSLSKLDQGKFLDSSAQAVEERAQMGHSVCCPPVPVLPPMLPVCVPLPLLLNH